MIVCLSGEKTNPTTMRYFPRIRSDVLSAVVASQGRFEAVLDRTVEILEFDG